MIWEATTTLRYCHYGKKRKTNFNTAKKKLQKEKGVEFVEVKTETSLKNDKFLLPWWFKIIAYSISFACIIVSINLILIKGK